MAHPIMDAMTSMTPAERAAYKASVYASRPTPDSLMAGTRMVAIAEGPTIENGMVRVVLNLWIDFGFGMEIQDIGAINPVYFKNPPILVPDPGGDITRTWTNHDGSTGSLVLREDPDQALMQACMDLLEPFVGTGGEM